MVQITGLKELGQRLKSDPISKPINTMLSMLGEIVTDLMIHLTPVWTEALEDSYSFELEGSPVADFVFIGSSLYYAPYVEYGTKPHWPPGTGKLAEWAEDHQIPVFLVQRSIARKGGPQIPGIQMALRASENLAAMQPAFDFAASLIELNIKA